ncbi:MAG: phosphotransferase [Leucobacter sp.]|nr:phosphotransferase [Leucobacter sp.]
MPSTPLTLAALATSAVPGLDVVAVREHSYGGEGSYATAVLTTPDDEVIIRVPRDPAAEVRQSAEMLGLSALTEGARSALPFDVPETLGITRAGDTRAVVSTFLPGGLISVEDLEADALLVQPIAEAVGAIHHLPTSLVHQAGLPMRSADDVRDDATRIVERAAGTGLLPGVVQARWSDALAAARLWDFAPTVIHGSLDAGQLLIADDRIVGVLGWDRFGVGDPAVDLAWLLAADADVFDAVLARYLRGSAGGAAAALRARARFTHELEVARWLLHGVETHDDAVIADAVAMLDRLVDRLNRLDGSEAERPPAPASVTEVVRMLDETPPLPDDPRSETAEYDALDEERVFTSDADFADDGPLVTDPDAADVLSGEPGSEPGGEPGSEPGGGAR